MSFATSGQWFWGNFGTTNIGNEYAWQNPGGGFATPCTSWGYGSSGCAVGGGVNRNNYFSIIGTSVVGGGPLPGGYTFLWSPAAGLSSTTSNPVAASPMNTTLYTVNVTTGQGCTRSASILITVNKRPTVTVHPVSRVNCGNTSATFSVTGTGTGLTYQWQESLNGCAGPWTNLVDGGPYSGVTTANLTVNPVTTAMNGRGYRAVLSGVCAPVNNANISNWRQLVAVRAEGFAPDFVWRDVGTDQGEIHFQLKPGHIYKGRITQPDGEPVGGAYVTVQSWNGMKHLDETVGTTPDGYYAFGSLPDSGLVFRVWRAGYVSSNGLVPSSTSDHNDFVLQPIVGVTGTVTDSQTGEPIKSFQVIPGQNYQGIAGARWQDYGKISGENGEFKFEPTDANESYALKITADGYLPQVTPGFAVKDLPKSFSIRMEKGDGPQGIVTFGDGRPASGINVAFQAEGQLVQISKSGFDHRVSQPGQQVTTDTEGRFKFAPELNGQMMVAIGPAGYGEAPFDPTTKEFRIVLKPFGTLTGEVKIPGVELGGTAVMIGGGSPGLGGGLMFDFNEFKVPVGDDGKFTINGVPPGKRKLIWLRQVAGSQMWNHVLTQDVEVEAGGITHFTMEVKGRIVKGRAVLSDPTKTGHWQFGFLRTPPPKPPGPFKSSADFDVWFKSPEMQAYRKTARNYSLSFETDGSFDTIPVEPGTYELTLSATDPNTSSAAGFGGRTIASLTRDIIVPEGNTPFDLGEVEVPVRIQLKVGMVAPDFKAIDAEGKPFTLANFRGRRVLIQFGDPSAFVSTPTDANPDAENMLSVMRRAIAENRLSIVMLTDPDAFQSAATTVVENHLPFVLGAMEKNELQKTQQTYLYSGRVIIGPDGAIEQLLPFRLPAQRAAQLETALLK